MEDVYSGAIVMDSNKDEIAKLTEKWKKIEKRGKTLSKVGNSSFIITLLSPFDFEGPVAEIVTAVVAVVGFIMKSVAKAKLNKLSGSDEFPFDKKDESEFKKTVDKITNLNNKSL